MRKPIFFTSVDFGHPNELCGRGFIDFMYHESSTLTVQKWKQIISQLHWIYERFCWVNRELISAKKKICFLTKFGPRKKWQEQVVLKAIFGPALSTKTGKKKIINSLKLSSLFSFLNKVLNSFMKFSMKPQPHKLLRNGRKFKSRKASHSNLTI